MGHSKEWDVKAPDGTKLGTVQGSSWNEANKAAQKKWRRVRGKFKITLRPATRDNS